MERFDSLFTQRLVKRVFKLLLSSLIQFWKAEDKIVGDNRALTFYHIKILSSENIIDLVERKKISFSAPHFCSIEKNLSCGKYSL